jgi:hypothetical protein
MSRRWPWVAIRVALSLALVGSLVELWARFSGTPPRVGLIRARKVEGFRVTSDGLFVYSLPALVRPCAERRPGVPTVSLFGSSITWGTGLPREEALGSRLEALFDRSPAGPHCVDDFSVPGFSQEQQWAVAREKVPETRPDVVLWEAWDPTKHYSVVGDVAFDARHRDVDEAGVPRFLPLPDGATDFLFRRSYAYQYATFALAPLLPVEEWERGPVAWVCDEALPSLVRVAGERGGRVFVLAATPLDVPFTEPGMKEDLLALLACAKKQGLPVLSIAEILSDQRVEDVRLDPCCHLNAKGHALLAERIAPRLGI